MKLLDVTNDGRYLYIHTDEGTRRQSLNWSGVAELEKQCREAIGQTIITSTWGDWDPSVWFQSIKVVSLETVTNTEPSPSLDNIDSSIPTGRIWETKDSQRIYGPPGTGKTTTLIETVVSAVQSGMKPEHIGYFAFTNVAADEARERISSESSVSTSSFSNFSTLHSLATRIGGALGNALCNNENLDRFDSNIVFSEEWLKAGDSSTIVSRPFHPVLDLYSLRINTKAPFLDWTNSREDKAQLVLEKFFNKKIDSSEVRQAASEYYKTYVAFKKANNLADYNDVIVNVVDPSFPDKNIPTFELLIIDEAQDLSALMWDFVKKLASKAKYTILAGDDDQAIMEAFGAAPKLFNQFPTTLPDQQLTESYRLPGNLKAFIDINFSNEIWAGLYPYRKAKSWTARQGSEELGTIISHRLVEVKNGESRDLSTQQLNFDDVVRFVAKNSTEEWLIMAPTKATCRKFSAALKALNVPHFLQRRDVLSKSNRIQIQTVHTSKGMGCDNVVVLCDPKSRGDKFMFEQDRRLLYVALTRSKSLLITVGLSILGVNQFKRAYVPEPGEFDYV